MIPVQFQTFMEFVLTQTRSGKLRWMHGESGSFIASHRDMSLYISSEYDPDREIGSFWFRLNGSDGSTPFSVYDHENEYNYMRVIYEEVIFNANNAERDVARFMADFD
ncbi:hypothetical protein [Pseudomonas sp. PS02303]|uniref:hypothetical protein n=1 Tax=Pseudomonas sp. PS02303 TaxID=2991429 RepID=UPI00249C1C1B|nr:hypothetical protein [Pseudomonas sp. PS02303]